MVRHSRLLVSENAAQATLPRDVPWWRKEPPAYLVTVRAIPRGECDLAKPGLAKYLIDSFIRKHEQGDWEGIGIVVMPRHVQMLVRESPAKLLPVEMTRWKKAAVKAWGVEWRHEDFEHRLGHEESVEGRMAWMRANPVRAGLCEHADDWEYWWSSERTIEEAALNFNFDELEK